MTATTARTTTTPRPRPGRRAPRAPQPASPHDLATLERIGRLLAEPAAFRAWLAALPPDLVLAPGGVQDRWYWCDPFESPLGQWLRATCGRAVWFYRRDRGRYRLLVSHDWVAAPEWATRFLSECERVCADLAWCRDAAHPLSPTPARALGVLDGVLGVVRESGAAG